MTFNFKTILVIGDNHEERIKKYSADTKVTEYVKYRYDDRFKIYDTRLALVKELAKSDANNNKYWTEAAEALEEMSYEDYFDFIARGMKIDPETHDAISDENPNSHYRYEACYDAALKSKGVEGYFSTPFTLKDGTKAYSAKKGEIDWSKMHMFNIEPYVRAWEMVVEGDEAKTDQEKIIKDNMNGRKGYFLNFKNKDEYVRYSCSWWCYGVITEDDTYREYGMYKEGDDMGWIFNFYDNFIKKLDDDTLLTIYEAKTYNQ